MKIIIPFVLFLLFLGCKPSDKEDSNENEQAIVKTQENIFCFGKRTIYSAKGGKSVASYEVVVFDLADPNNVEGYYKYFPYDTKSNFGHFTGTYDPNTGIVSVNTSSYADGMHYENKKVWKIEDDKLYETFKRVKLQPNPTPEELSRINWVKSGALNDMKCSTFDKWMVEVYSDRGNLNETPHLNRLDGIDVKGELTEENVIERALNIDPSTNQKETIFYLRDSKELFIINDDNEIVNRYENIEPPVLSSMKVDENGWKKLIVKTNNKLFKLSHSENGYLQDPTKGEEMKEREALWHPEEYFQLIYVKE